jgi:hypothetical protein
LIFTALDLITLAYTSLGNVGTGQTLTANLSTIGMKTLNILIDSFGAQRNMLYSRERLVVPYTVGAGQYLIGPDTTAPPSGYGPNIPGDRPVVIESWSTLLGNIGGNPPLELTHRRTVSQSEYDVFVTLKTLQSTFPTILFYNPKSPNGELNFWPVPNQGGNSMVLYFPPNLAQITTLTTHLLWPPGYLKGVQNMLAADLAPMVGRDVPTQVEKEAIRMRRFIKARNSQSPELSIPFNKAAGYYDWLSDRII